MRLDAGTVFADRFRVVRLLSEGGFGTVYVAEQLQTGRERALKILHPHHGEDPDVRAKFAQEAKIGASIASDHVVEVLDAGFDPATGSPWLAMELLEGETLEALVQRRGALPRAEALSILRQVAHALAAAHAVGVVHRDLKAENVFVARTRSLAATTSVKVLDFGIARWLQESKTATAASQAIGTPMWMAPEQAEHGGRISAATDVWALGLLAFYALTGRMFWLAASDAKPSISVLLAELVANPIPPATRRAAELGADPEAVRPFEDWLARCLERDPRRRPTDAADAMAQLEAARRPAVDPFEATAAVTPPTLAMATPAPTAPMPEPEAPRLPTRSRAPLVLGGVAAILVVAGLGALSLAPGPDALEAPPPEPVDAPVVDVDDPEPAPAPVAASPTTGRVRISTDIERAQLHADDDEHGPLRDGMTVELAPGAHRLVARRGRFDLAVRQVTVRAGETVGVTMSRPIVLDDLELDEQPDWSGWTRANRGAASEEPERGEQEWGDLRRGWGSTPATVYRARARRALDQRYGARVRRCYARYEARGEVLMRFIVAQSGEITDTRRFRLGAQSAPGTPGAEAVGRCLDGVFGGGRLPRPPSDHYILTHTFSSG